MLRLVLVSISRSNDFCPLWTSFLLYIVVAIKPGCCKAPSWMQRDPQGPFIGEKSWNIRILLCVCTKLRSRGQRLEKEIHCSLPKGLSIIAKLEMVVLEQCLSRAPSSKGREKKKIAVLKGGQPLQLLVDNCPEQCYQRSTHVLETSLKGNSTDLRTQYALRSFQTHP